MGYYSYRPAIPIKQRQDIYAPSFHLFHSTINLSFLKYVNTFFKTTLYQFLSVTDNFLSTTDNFLSVTDNFFPQNPMTVNVLAPLYLI